MGHDQFQRFRRATDIEQDPAHPAWDAIMRRIAMDDQQDARDIEPFPGGLTDKEWLALPAELRDDPEGAFVVHTGDESGGTSFFPLLGRVARRLGGALLSYFGVRR